MITYRFTAYGEDKEILAELVIEEFRHFMPRNINYRIEYIDPDDLDGVVIETLWDTKTEKELLDKWEEHLREKFPQWMNSYKLTDVSVDAGNYEFPE